MRFTLLASISACSLAMRCDHVKGHYQDHQCCEPDTADYDVPLTPLVNVLFMGNSYLEFPYEELIENGESWASSRLVRNFNSSHSVPALFEVAALAAGRHVKAHAQIVGGAYMCYQTVCEANATALGCTGNPFNNPEMGSDAWRVWSTAPRISDSKYDAVVLQGNSFEFFLPSHDPPGALRADPSSEGTCDSRRPATDWSYCKGGTVKCVDYLAELTTQRGGKPYVLMTHPRAQSAIDSGGYVGKYNVTTAAEMLQELEGGVAQLTAQTTSSALQVIPAGRAMMSLSPHFSVLYDEDGSHISHYGGVFYAMAIARQILSLTDSEVHTMARNLGRKSLLPSAMIQDFADALLL